MLAANPLPAPIPAHPVTRELEGLDPIWPRQGGLPNEQFFCPSPFPVLKISPMFIFLCYWNEHLGFGPLDESRERPSGAWWGPCLPGCCLKRFGVLPLCFGCGLISIVRAVCSPVSADFQVSAFCQPHCLLRSEVVFLIKGITATIEVINENCVLVAAAPIGLPIVSLGRFGGAHLHLLPSAYPAPSLCPCFLDIGPVISLLTALFLSPVWFDVLATWPKEDPINFIFSEMHGRCRELFFFFSHKHLPVVSCTLAFS